MSFDKLLEKIKSEISGLHENETWNSLAAAQQKSMIKRAVCDISAYAANLGTDTDFEDALIISAVCEQTLHIARQSCFGTDGRLIEEESITGFGSRRYKYTASELLSERAKFYIDSYADKKRQIRTVR